MSGPLRLVVGVWLFAACGGISADRVAGGAAGGAEVAGGAAGEPATPSTTGGSTLGGAASGQAGSSSRAGSSAGGSQAGEPSGGQAGSGDADPCSLVAPAPVGRGLCQTPTEVELVEGLIDREASLDYDLSDASCGVVSGFDATVETSAAFVFRRSPIDEGGFNVSAVYPWSYTLEGRDSSNDLPEGEVLVATLRHECGVELVLEFELSLGELEQARVQVHDVRTPGSE